MTGSRLGKIVDRNERSQDNGRIVEKMIENRQT